MMFMAMELGYETGIWNILGYGLFFFCRYCEPFDMINV